MLIILFILIYTAVGCFFVTFTNKFEDFKCKGIDEKLLQGVFWPFILVIFLLYIWCKFCVKISKKILKQ